MHGVHWSKLDQLSLQTQTQKYEFPMLNLIVLKEKCSAKVSLRNFYGWY